jgi:hypothetical protein
MNLYQKLAKIRALSDVVKKEKSGYGYKYVDITAILAQITAGMKKYGVSLIPSIVPSTSNVSQNVMTNTKLDKTGKEHTTVTTEMLVSAEMTFTWVNDEKPEETIVVPWLLLGAMSDVSQSFGSACSYGLRQFLTTYFQIAQTDYDIDAFRSKQKEAEAAEETAIAQAIVENIDAAVKEYIGSDKTKGEDIKKFMKNYVKDSNYLKIKDPTLAAKVLEDFTNTYINKESK